MIRILKEEEYAILEKKFNIDSIKMSKNYNPFREYIISEVDGIIIGYMIFDYIYDRIEIVNIYILDEYRNKGYAKKIFNFLFNTYSSIKNITLEVNENNIAAINLYKSVGFNSVGIRKNYYKENNGILMKKEMIE